MSAQVREIALTRNKVCLVDEEDYDLVRAWKWRASPGRCLSEKWYAIRNLKSCGSSRTLYMHRAILGAQRGVLVDHINGDGLDNRRVNLRLCDHSQNAINTERPRSSPYRGVWQDRSGRWSAHIEKDGRAIRLGTFAEIAHAAYAYDLAATSLHGEFSILNLTGAPAGFEEAAVAQVGGRLEFAKVHAAAAKVGRRS